MVTPYVVAFIVTLALSLVLTPLVMKLAVLVGAIDKPNQRKVHKVPTPRLGGVAIFFSFFGGLLCLSLYQPVGLSDFWISGREGMMFLGAIVIVLFLGIWDDIRSLHPGQKFLVQLVLSIVIYFAGFSVSNVTNVFGSGTTTLGYFDFPLTVLWIVGVTNALNLIDGLDGLAAGVALIAAGTILPISLLNGDQGTSILALLLVGSLFGFLRYNFNPAKIFLGDSGSLFLGFMLAVLSVKSSTKSSTGFALLVPILALGLPIMDTLLSMMRRFLNSFLTENTSPESLVHRLKNMFQPDSSHIHHRLIGRGLTHRNAVLTLYIVSCLLGVGAFIITVTNNHIASLILLVVAGAIIIGVRQLKYKEMAVLQNGVLLPLYDKPIMSRESFQVFFDLAAIIISFSLAQFLSGWMSPADTTERNFLSLLAAITATQLAVFWFSGMYKRTFKILGMGDVLRTLKGVMFAIGASAVVLNTVHYPIEQEQIGTLIVDFFFLGLFVVGVRISFQVLLYLSSQASKAGKKVVIYGADPNGILMLERMLEANIATWTPVGFLDDDPSLEGKYFNGYPVFGSHWNLPKLIKEKGIDEIVLCSENIKAEALRRMRNYAKKNNISVKRMRILFEDYHEDKFESAPAPIFQLHTANSVVKTPLPQEKTPVPNSGAEVLASGVSTRKI